MTPRKPKVYTGISASLEPFAECTEDGCEWGAPRSPVTKARADRHVLATGHSVRVVQENVRLRERQDPGVI